MQIALKGLVIIVGNYGSGKTEVAINLAVHRRRAGVSVRLADLDLVNPYFRTREARGVLGRLGIEVVLPPARYLNADLPILDPAVAGLIRQPSELTILDAGGDDVGATVLSALHHVLAEAGGQVLQVVNPLRPFTDTHAGCRRIRREIEAAARLKVTGLVGNANLIDDTEPAQVIEGYRFVKALAEESGLPLVFVTVPHHLAAACGVEDWVCPALPIRRQLVPPWIRPADLGPDSSNGLKTS
ncbi:MAG TPA: cobalamin biosynthesis protein CbiA [Desulfobacteraceae bacterium]|nr:cobalamin biosynthesis protein CbiA [Deltaproteobacteria bacterium]MBW2356924.1 cobalamin biosynthesis protein CbiA [Deltaproteobacteria bacterium]HDI58830.1 cobalamin biosynthesis protein CbiA [Desulfobacteraceae bacterium]